jgi:hypothetical protein
MITAISEEKQDRKELIKRRHQALLSKRPAVAEPSGDAEEVEPEQDEVHELRAQGW